MMHNSNAPPVHAAADAGMSHVPKMFFRWLLVGVLVLNAIAIWFSLISIQNDRKHYEQQAEIQTQNLAQALDQSISHAADKINQSLRSAVFEIERQLALDAVDYAVLRDLMDRQRALLPEAIGFRIFDAGGTLLLGGGGSVNPSAKIGDRDYFTFHKTHKDGGMHVSRLLSSRFTNEYVVAFTMRFNHPDGSFAGIVSIPVSTDYFERLASRYLLGEQGLIALRDLNLGLIVRHPMIATPPTDEHGTPATAILSGLIRSGTPQGTYRATQKNEGISRILSFRRAEKLPIIVIAGLAESDYLQRWREDVLETLVILMLFILATSTAGWLLHRAWKRQLGANLALQHSNQQLESLFRQLHERDSTLLAAQTVGKMGTYRHDIQGNHFTSSPEMNALFGIDASYPRTFESWLNLVHPDDRTMMTNYFEHEIIGKNRVFNITYRIVRPSDGHIVWLHGYGELERDASGQPVALSGVILDVTERKRHEEQLQLANEVFMNTREAITITDEKGCILNVNPAFSEITGYSRDEAIGQNPRLLQSGRQDNQFYQQMWQALLQNGYWEGEFQNRRKDGLFYTQATKISAIKNERGRIIRLTAIASDVTQVRASQKQIEHYAFHDKLTDLPNRAKLAGQLQLAITHAHQTRTLLGVCYLDLDGFKQLNDKWGHDIGDMVLVEVAMRLQSCVNTSDTVARLGGDEFVVLLGNAHHVSEIEQTLRHILNELAKPFRIGDQQAELSASIGMALYPDDIEDADILIRRADQAMYVAKRQGKNRFNLFDSETDRRLRAQNELVKRIGTGINDGEFRLYYQPKVDMFAGKIVGAEALIRWQHPELGLLPPADFLPATENSELAIRLGEWVITQALAQIASWKSVDLDLPISVNIDGYHLQQADFVQRLSILLAAFPGVSPDRLQLEILETSAMENIDAVSSLISRCLELGVSFALDDFGTGYSSLTYFRRLPTQQMKIDRSFVQDMLNDPEDFALVEGIVKLANSLQREVIAEGVESIEHGLALMQIGCHLAQGYGIARPMPPESVPQWVDNWVVPQVWHETAKNLRDRS